MLYQKMLHLPMRRELARARLANLYAYRHEVEGLEAARISADGMAHLRFHAAPWCSVCVDLAEVETANPWQTLFASRAGNIVACGGIEYFATSPINTEAVITVDYRLKVKAHRLLDALSGRISRYLEEQFDRVEAYFHRPVVGVRADRNLPAPINGKRPTPKR